MHSAGNYFLNPFVSSTAATSLAVGCLAGITLAPPAWAEDYTAVVTGDNVYIRCGAGPTYYPFGKLNKGAVVQVSGEEFGWAHIQTAGTAFDDMFGYVKADEVRLSADGKSATTLGVVQVLAPNSLRDYEPESSWKWVCRLQPEVAVEVIGREEGQAEMFYRVALPDVGRGFISVNFLRKATAAEIVEEKRRLAERDGKTESASRNESNNRDDTTSTTSGPLSGAVEQANEVESQLLDDIIDNAPEVEREIEITDARDRIREQQDESADSGQQPTHQDATTESEVSIPVEYIDQPRIQQEQPRDVVVDSTSPSGIGVDFDDILSQPADSQDTNIDLTQPIEREIYTDDLGTLEESSLPVDDLNEDTLIDIDDMQPMDTEPVRTDLPIDMNFTLADVEEAYSRLKTEPLREAEIEPLRQRYLALQETELDERDRALVDARVTLLDARVRLQEKMFELDRLRARANEVDEQAETVRIAVESARDYVAVGEVAASTIYNGERLPQMLRLADPATGRTVAYLDPREADIEVGSLIGQLVGVLGEKHYDEGMRLTIVRPIRIDLLTPTVANRR